MEEKDFQDTETVDRTVRVRDAEDDGVKVTKVEGAPDLEEAKEEDEE